MHATFFQQYVSSTVEIIHQAAHYEPMPKVLPLHQTEKGLKEMSASLTNELP